MKMLKNGHGITGTQYKTARFDKNTWCFEADVGPAAFGSLMPSNNIAQFISPQVTLVGVLIVMGMIVLLLSENKPEKFASLALFVLLFLSLIFIPRFHAQPLL